MLRMLITLTPIITLSGDEVDDDNDDDDEGDDVAAEDADTGSEW